jgi:hypothetical protein
MDNTVARRKVYLQRISVNTENPTLPEKFHPSYLNHNPLGNVPGHPNLELLTKEKYTSRKAQSDEALWPEQKHDPKF